MVAFDCSTKSRAREIPRVFPDGSHAPAPLRSDEFPLGLPTLSGRDAERVGKDNLACVFVLQQLQAHALQGGVSVRENPRNSLHWSLPAEVAMHESGAWYDYDYDSCVFQGPRRKKQRLRHNLAEMAQWPDGGCRHLHQSREWAPTQESAGTSPTKEEAEYTAALAFSIAVAAVRMGVAQPEGASHAPSYTHGRSKVMGGLASSGYFHMTMSMWGVATTPIVCHPQSGPLALCLDSMGPVKSASCSTSRSFVNKILPHASPSSVARSWCAIVRNTSFAILMF